MPIENQLFKILLDSIQLFPNWEGAPDRDFSLEEWNRLINSKMTFSVACIFASLEKDARAPGLPGQFEKTFRQIQTHIDNLERISRNLHPKTKLRVSAPDEELTKIVLNRIREDYYLELKKGLFLDVPRLWFPSPDYSQFSYSLIHNRFED